MKNPLFSIIVLLLVFSRPASAQVRPVVGADFSLFTGYSSQNGWEMLSLYPFVGVSLELGLYTKIMASANAGFSGRPGAGTSYQYAGNLTFFHEYYVIGVGGGMESSYLTDDWFSTYAWLNLFNGFYQAKNPFIRAEAGLGILNDGLFALKLFADYSLNDKNFTKFGLLMSFGWEFDELGYSSYTPAPRPTPPPTPAPEPVRPPEPHWTPTITPEELKKVELAYAETVRDIERRGRRLSINNRSERAAFIQRYQGWPDTGSADAARNEKLPYFNSRDTSEQDIVRQARAEANPFRKVRMIHDWVADIFSYDNDLLWWMRNVSGRNAEFSLGELVNRKRGVCFEYAILFWFLMDAAGVETYLISEVVNPTSAHAYNMMVINGTGYIIDTTWDSGNQYENSRIIQFYMTNFKGYFMPGISESYRLRTSQSPKWR